MVVRLGTGGKRGSVLDRRKGHAERVLIGSDLLGLGIRDGERDLHIGQPGCKHPVIVVEGTALKDMDQ